uniref:Uncharacterized protein n=1 Tax=Arundo donax TaxID=35708 RepID=A0A0A9HNJ9_ARUDO
MDSPDLRCLLPSTCPSSSSKTICFSCGPACTSFTTPS